MSKLRARKGFPLYDSSSQEYVPEFSKKSSSGGGSRKFEKVLATCFEGLACRQEGVGI